MIMGASEGLIEVIVEGPQLVRLRFTGLVDEHDAIKAVAQSAAAVGEQPYAILCETPNLKGLTPKARKAFADGFGKVDLVAVAMIRPSLPTRALSTFVVAAINILRPKRRMEIAFFDEDDTARRWATGLLTTGRR